MDIKFTKLRVWLDEENGTIKVIEIYYHTQDGQVFTSGSRKIIKELNSMPDLSRDRVVSKLSSLVPPEDIEFFN